MLRHPVTAVASMLDRTSGRLSESTAVGEPTPIPLDLSAWENWLARSRVSL